MPGCPCNRYVVLRTSPANASPLAVAMDAEKLEEVVGSIVGDDASWLLLRAPRSPKNSANTCLTCSQCERASCEPYLTAGFRIRIEDLCRGPLNLGEFFGIRALVFASGRHWID